MLKLAALATVKERAAIKKKENKEQREDFQVVHFCKGEILIEILIISLYIVYGVWEEGVDLYRQSPSRCFRTYSCERKLQGLT